MPRIATPSRPFKHQPLEALWRDSGRAEKEGAMQAYKGRHLQVFSAVRDYESDLFSLGLETVSQLVGSIENPSLGRDPFLPQLALVFFTHAAVDPDDSASPSSEPLRQLCAGINAGLVPYPGQDEAVPLIGCSVASIPNVESQRIHRKGFSITLLAARRRDLDVRVGGSCGFVEEEEGYVKAWDQCLRRIEEQRLAPEAERMLTDDGFVLALFPGLIEGATDFKTRNLASYRYLRSKVNSHLPIYGAGAGELDSQGRQRRPPQSHVMAGTTLFPNGYACARVRTTLRFEMSMEHNLKMASEVLLVKKLKEGKRGRSIISFAVPPDYETVPASQALENLKSKYETQRFAFHAFEFSEERESLLFLSVDPKDDVLHLVSPVSENTVIRPAFADISKLFLLRAVSKRPPDDAPIAMLLLLTCSGIFRMLGKMEEEREATVLRQLQRSTEESTQTRGYPLISGFAFGEWGLGPDMNGQAQYYHSTGLIFKDALTPRHHQRRQLEVIDQCSRDMYAALLRAEEQISEPRLTTRQAATVLSKHLFDAIAGLGYEGGLVSLVNEIDQTIVGAEAYGDPWLALKKATVVRLDEPDLLAKVYRNAGEQQAERHIADSGQEPDCRREAAAGVVSQTVLPLWEGRRCLGILQVGHPGLCVELPDHERNALSTIARTAALHLGRIKAQETIRDLEEAVRYAVACDDQEKGWCHLAQVAARAVEVPFCTIRVLDQTRSSLKIVGGSQELFGTTRQYGRTYTPLEKGEGPVVSLFRRFLNQQQRVDARREVYVVQDTTKDPDLEAITGAVSELAPLYKRVRSYALGALVSSPSELTGVISFLAFRSGFFTPERVDLVRKIAGYASIVAKVYQSAALERTMLQTTLSLATIQAQVDRILRSARDFEADFEIAARLLVTETVKILPCEACTLHRFEKGQYLILKAAAPDDSIHEKQQWDTLNPEDQGFLLHLATLKDVYRAAGERLRRHPRIRVQTGVWTWLPKTKKLHSILAIPLVDPDGRHYGLLTLYNRLNEEGQPHDKIDFTDVPTRVRSFLQEIATHVLESFESHSRLASLAKLGEELQGYVDNYSSAALVSSETVFRTLAESIARWLDARICSIFLVKPGERQIVLRGCFGWHSGDQMVHRATYEFGEGLTGILVQNSEPEVISSIFSDPRRTGKYFEPMYGSPDQDRTYEMIALPLRQGADPLGIITVYRKLPREYAHLLGFSERDTFALKLASHLASLAVAAIVGEPATEDSLMRERPAIAEILSVAAKERLRALDYNQLAGRIATHFHASLCGIFLTPSQDPNMIVLSGANGELVRYVDKIRIEQHDGPVGEAFASRKTQFRDRREDQSFIGLLDQTLRECLDEPPQNLMTAPMCLGEECGGVILLVNRTPLSRSEQRAKSLLRYHLEALGTGILLVRRNIEFSAYHETYQQAIVEQLTATELSSAAQTLAHEARNRLNTIASCVSVVRNPNASEEIKEERLGWIESIFESFAATVGELLEPMRRAGAPELVDLVDVTQKAVELNSALAEERNIHLINEVEEQTFIKGRRIQMIGVLGTILENAIEACERGTGKVRITLRPAGEDGMIGLSVHDNGCGIAPGNQRRIFVRGFSTKDRKGKERGYGLHTARIVVLFHSGDINVESTPGAGTRMTVWLPGEV